MYDTMTRLSFTTTPDSAIRPKHRHHAEGDIHQHVSPHCADQAERNGTHDDQGLNIRPERDGEERKDGQQGDPMNPVSRPAMPSACSACMPSKDQLTPGIAREHLRQNSGLKVGVDRCR